MIFFLTKKLGLLTHLTCLLPATFILTGPIPAWAYPESTAFHHNRATHHFNLSSSLSEFRTKSNKNLVPSERSSKVGSSQRLEPDNPFIVEGTLDPEDEPFEINIRDLTFGGENSFSDVYHFEGKAGQIVLISMESDELDSSVFLVNENNELLGLNDDSGPNSRHSRLVYVLPKDGPYKLVASSYELQETGGYKIFVRQVNQSDLQWEDADQLILWGNEADRASRFYEAIQSYDLALKVYQLFGSPLGESAALLGLGSVSESLGDYPKALQYYEQGLEKARSVSDLAYEAMILQNMGTIHLQTQRYSEALSALERSLEIFTDIGDGSGVGTSLTNIGNVYSHRENWVEALRYYEQSLEVSRFIDYAWLEAHNLASIAGIYVEQEKYSQALEAIEQSLTIFRDFRSPAILAQVLRSKAVILQLMGQLNQAEALLYEALEMIDATRREELDDSQKIKLFETQRTAYLSLQQILIAQNKINKAVEISERGRARAFIQLISQNLVTQNNNFLEISSPTSDDVRNIAQKQSSTIIEYSIINTGIGNPSLYIWIISPEGEINFTQTSLEDVDLQELVIKSRESLGARGRTGISVETEISLQQQQAAQTEKLAELYKLLISPIEDYLPRNPTDSVIFIPQDELFLVPFSALIDNEGEYLIQKHTILTSPSIQILDFTRQQQENLGRATPDNLSAEDVLIVGNPTMPTLIDSQGEIQTSLAQLPGTEREVLDIASRLQTEALLNDDATEAVVKARIEQARLIHLATHGLLDYGELTRAGVGDAPGAVALAAGNGEDGLLTTSEILAMNLQANLAILSACDTGRGTLTGDGVIGLSRGLMAAGVPSVIVSLWKVPDDATAYLMNQFYENWELTENKAIALRLAMLNTMKMYPDDPLSWAGFTLIGEAM